MQKASLVVLISGTGSNLQAIIDAIRNGRLDAEIKAVISNRPAVKGLERATMENIPTHVIDHQQFPSREAFERAVSKIINPLQPDLIVLAGFMRILSDEFIEHYQHRLINIHPSLLPKYKGLNTHHKAISNGDKIHGASVHYVTPELDSGPVVIQAEVPVYPADTEESLAKRVLHEEHQILPLAIDLHLQGRVKFDNNGQLLLDNRALVHPLLWKNNRLE